jgi:hypothetical protein
MEEPAPEEAQDRSSHPTRHPKLNTQITRPHRQISARPQSQPPKTCTRKPTRTREVCLFA